MNIPEFWRRKALCERHQAHLMRSLYPRDNWRFWYSLDIGKAIQSWKHYRRLLELT